MKEKVKKLKPARVKRKPNMFEALSAVIVLLVIFFFGSLADLSAPALIGIAVGYVVFIGWRCGYSWEDMEGYTAEKIKSAAPAMSVLLACLLYTSPAASSDQRGGRRTFVGISLFFRYGLGQCFGC